jgi:hypothetical protein
MSRKDAFVKEHLDTLLLRDPVVGNVFRDEKGIALKRENPIYQERFKKLEDAIGTAYETKATELPAGKENFFQKYVAKPLRVAAAGAYGLGTYMFFALPGPAGFGFTGLGAVGSGLADLIDYTSYCKQGQLKGGLLQHTLLIGESVLEKAIGYFPGGGILDLYRSKSKFTGKITSGFKTVVADTLAYAKYLFLGKEGTEKKDGRKTVPLRLVKDSPESESAEPEAVAA